MLQLMSEVFIMLKYPSSELTGSGLTNVLQAALFDINKVNFNFVNGLQNQKSFKLLSGTIILILVT